MNEELTEVVYEGVSCQLAIVRPATNVVIVKLDGWDTGEFSDIPMQELAKDIAGGNLIELFIDARDSKGASVEVSSQWAQWLGKHRSCFKHVSMLTGSRFIQLTADFVRRFAELGELMRIYTDPVAFDAALAESINRK